MALTDIYISPAGAGDSSGSSVANALPAISSGDWSTTIEALDRADKRFIWLEGTYNCTTTLDFSGSAPSKSQPNQWVGADASGNILRPKFNEASTGLDISNYPVIIQSNNTRICNTEEETGYKCISFQNSSGSYSQSGIIDQTISDMDLQSFEGCHFKAAPASDSAIIIEAQRNKFYMCEMHANSTQYHSVVSLTNPCDIDSCIIHGGGVSVTSGNCDGVETSSGQPGVKNCLIYDIGRHGFINDATNIRNAGINMVNNTIVNCGSDGINTATMPSADSAQSANIIGGCVIFGCGGYGINTGADDSRMQGTQLIAAGSNTSGNFNNLDSHEDAIDVINITTGDFVDYTNKDFRIKRTSSLYKIFGNANMGGVQNEDYEFTSVS
tara:strand:+ start:607 stop:1755 length:1149 start_codon:yes stop_codon:yes gene_type:complete